MQSLLKTVLFRVGIEREILLQALIMAEHKLQLMWIIYIISYNNIDIDSGSHQAANWNI